MLPTCSRTIAKHVSIDLTSMFARLKTCSIGAPRHFQSILASRTERIIRPFATMRDGTSQRPKALLHCGERPALHTCISCHRLHLRQ